jgi:hypothetical protein
MLENTEGAITNEQSRKKLATYGAHDEKTKQKRQHNEMDNTMRNPNLSSKKG